MVTDIAPTELATADKDGTEMHARSQPAPTIATIMVSALMASAIAVLDLLEKIAHFVLAPQTATTTVSALTTLVSVTPDGLDSIAHSSRALLSAPETDTATTALASASLDSPECSAPSPLVHHLARATDSVCLLEPKCLASVMRDTRATTAQRRPAPMIALTTESVSAGFVHARTDGVELTVLVDALVMDNDAAETASVWRDSAIATQDGPVTLVTQEHACMIAHNTDTATTEPACAKRATVDVIAHSQLSLNLASAQFTV